jgi:hypothetical protein
MKRYFSLENGSSMFLRNIGIYRQVRTALLATRQISTSFHLTLQKLPEVIQETHKNADILMEPPPSVPCDSEQ